MDSFESFLLNRRRPEQSPELQCYLAACRTSEKNAAFRGIEFHLSRSDLMALWQRAAGKCEVTGLPLDASAMPSPNTRRPWAPSLDRIDSKGCYETSNVRVVCVAANLAMNEWGEEVLKRLAIAIFHNGGFTGPMGSGLTPTRLPKGVRAYKAKDSIRYHARVKGVHVGSYGSVVEAEQAQKDYLAKNALNFPQAQEKSLCSPVNGGVADGTRTDARGYP